jgi:TP901 family phage tail tape measure protein
MANKDASVRLNLAAAGFSSSLQALQKQAKEFAGAVDEIGDSAQKSDRKAGGLFSAFKAGASGAKNSVVGLGSELKSVLRTAVTLGGALSIGAAIHGAHEVTESYKDLAFAIRTGTGAATSWQDVQKDVEAVSDRWKRKNGEVAESYADLFQITGDASFSKSAIMSVAEAATASGKPVKTLSEIAGTLNEKFGITAEEVPKALATTLQLGNKGGASIEELGSKLGNVGASAKLLGMSGQKGLEQILSMLNMADDAIGPPRQKFAALGSLLEGLADPEKMKAVQKALNVQLVDSKGQIKTDALDRILAKTKGQQSELAKVFSGPELKLIGSLGQKFADGFKGTSGNAQTKIAGGLDAFHKALAEGGKVTFDAAALQKEATGRLDDSERNMTQALNDFQKTFERPEMVKAIDQVAEAAPKLAHFLGDLVEFATNHPILAGAAVVGGTAAKGALTGAVGSLSKSAATAAGEAISGSFTAAVAKSGAWGVAGQALGVAAAALIAYEIGKAKIDEMFQKRGQEVTDLATASAEAGAAASGKDPGRKAAAAETLRKQIEAAEKNKPGFVEQAFAVGANMVDKDVAVDEHENNVARARAQLAELEKSMAPGSTKAITEGSSGFIPAGKLPPVAAAAAAGPSADARRVAGEVLTGDRKTSIANADVLASAVARQLAATTLNMRVVGGGGSGTNGLPGTAGNDSGSTPR